jgi:hypothetical protein
MIKITILIAILYSTLGFGKFIDQNDYRFVELNLKEKGKDSSLCGPVSVANWLIDNNIIKDLDGISLINKISSEIKLENNIDVRAGLTTNDLKIYLDKIESELHLNINPTESDLFSFNYEKESDQKKLLSVLDANKNQILLIKFMEIRKRSGRYNYNPMSDYNPGNDEPLYSFHYVFKKGTTKDGKLLLIDPEMPEKILTFQYSKNENGLYLLGLEAGSFKYVTIPNYQAQIKSIISLEN